MMFEIVGGDVDCNCFDFLFDGFVCIGSRFVCCVL